MPRPNINIFIAFAAVAVSIIAAEDVTETTPERLGPALGITSTPLAVGYRMSMGGHYSFDLMLHVPEYIKTANEGSGFEIGTLVGYNIPMRIEENIAFVIRPQLDITYITESEEIGNDTYDTKTWSVRPGAFAGIEVFLEEVGVPNVNFALGFTAGMEYNSTNCESEVGDSDYSTFRIPMATSPFGATVGLWWYF
ncbi:hypothetical protein DRQ36_03860 [bacterium]|nr:MAG: hypothetical protein DRQ36_03860 [bacterium]